MTRQHALLSALALTACLALGCLNSEATAEAKNDGWVDLFNGKDLSGWKASEHPDTFKVTDGVLVVHGPRAHLFYAGDVANHTFKNFEWRCEVMTKPGSNSGMYFHTEYQDGGWPAKGYEVQVNNTHKDPKKTGGLYAIKDVMNNSPVKDNEWFTQDVTVTGKHIVIKVNGKVTTDYTESGQPPKGMEGRRLSSGTFAIQGHDPKSEVHFRKIQVKVLPD